MTRPGELLLAALLALGGCSKDQPPTAGPDGSAEILARSELPALLAKPLADDPTQVTIHRLSNGMTVYIAPDHAEPRVTAWVAVRTGSRNDPATAPGLAHYLEHMLLFKGTDEFGTIDHEAEKPHLERIRELYRKLPSASTDGERTRVFEQIDAETQEVGKLAVPNEITRLYTTLGFSGMNAFTDAQTTHYVAEVPSNRLDVWAQVEAERLADPVFRLFYPELEAVYEEKNRGLDNAARQTYVAMVEGLFPEHPYRQRTLGTVESLKTPAFDEMVAFYERWYVPNNMAIILAGDVDSSVLPVLESAFGRLRPQPLPQPPAGKVAPIEGRVIKELAAEDRPLVRIAWPTVPAGHPDAVVLDVISSILDSDRVGILHVDLVQPHKVQWAGADRIELSEAGCLYLEALPREGDSLEDAEHLLLAAMERVRKGDFDAAQLDAVKRWLKIGRQAQLEFPASTASRLLWSYANQRQWADVVADDARHAAVSVDDVKRVATKYFGEDRIVVLRRRGDPGLPKVAKPKITKLSLDDSRASKRADALRERPAPPIEPSWLEAGRDYELGRVDAGRLVVAPNRRSDLFQLIYYYRRGYADVPTLCASVGALQRSGAGEESAEALQHKLYRMGVTVRIQCGEDETSIVTYGDDESLEEAVELVERWLRSPNTSDEIVSAQIDSAIEIRTTNRDREGTVVDALRQYAWFDKRSGFLIAPTDRQLRAMTPDTVRRDVGELLRLQHDTLYYGPRAISEATKVVSLGGRDSPARPRRERKYRSVEGPTIFFVDRGLAKATVDVVLPTSPRSRDDQSLADVSSRYLGGGIGSLVFREIRTARGLAYSVDAGVDLGRTGDDGRVWGYMQNQPDKVAEAVPALLDALRRPEVEAASFRTALQGTDRLYRSGRIKPLFVAPSVQSWFEDGLQGDPRPRYFASVQSMDLEQVEAFLRELTTAHPIIAIVGDGSRIDFSTLESVAAIRQVDLDQLFSY